MALKKMANYCQKLADRADRRGMHAYAQIIRETLDDYQWAYFEPQIANAIESIFIFQPDTKLEDNLQTIAENSGLTLDELLSTPHILEYLDYIKRREQRCREIDREAAIRYKEKYGEKSNN